METVIGIDLGTQSIKVLFYQAASQLVVATANSPLDLIQDQQGKAEQDIHWWLSALADCMWQIPQNIRDTAVAISVSGQQHGFVALDKQGEVLAPVKLWCDTSTTVECAEIIAAFGGEVACINKLGNPIKPGYTAPKILWLKKNRPQAYEKLSTILLPHDYLNFHLTGKITMEFGDASGTGLMDIRNRCWSTELLKAIDSERNLMDCLPPLAEQTSAIVTAGHLTADIAEYYGLPAGIPVATGGGDNMMGAIGTGNVDQGVVTISLGTSGTVYAHHNKPVVDEQARLAAFCSSTGGWLPLLCIMNCTASTELIRQLFNTNLPEMETKISATVIGANGVLTLPFYQGERSPNLPNAKATILGLDTSNMNESNLLRSAMEGTCFGLRLGVEALKDNGISIKEIRLIGGGSHSASWRQMLADICNIEVVLIAIDEGAAFGAALQALSLHKHEQLRQLQATTATDAYANIRDICDKHVKLAGNSRCQPIEKNVSAYEKVYQQYKKAVHALTPYYQ